MQLKTNHASSGLLINANIWMKSTVSYGWSQSQVLHSSLSQQKLAEQSFYYYQFEEMSLGAESVLLVICAVPCFSYLTSLQLQLHCLQAPEE